MDAKDLEIANLKGQVEAYQEQLRSAAIELLRHQVSKLKEADESFGALILQNRTELGRQRTEFEGRFSKALAAFSELQNKVDKLLEAERIIDSE